MRSKRKRYRYKKKGVCCECFWGPCHTGYNYCAWHKKVIINPSSHCCNQFHRADFARARNINDKK